MRDPKPDPVRGPMDIVTRLSQHAAELRPAEQEIAQIVLNDIVEAVADSTQMLAECTGMSEISITRFAEAMDCHDVRELRLKLAQAATVDQRFSNGDADHPPSSADGILVDISSMLEANRALVRPEVFRAAVVALVAACMIAIFGMGDDSTTVTDEMRYRLARLGRPVIICYDSILQRMVAATFNPDGVVVVFPVTDHVPKAIDSMTIAYEYGVQIIAITAIGPPSAALANVLLPIQTMKTDLIFRPSSSRYAMMMMANLLAIEVTLQQTDRSKELLRHIKYVLDAHRGGGSRQPLGD